MNAQIHSISDYIADDDLILVPEGQYELAYQYHATWLYMGRYPKVSVTFRIMDIGEHYEKPVLAHYNPKRIMGKPRKNGQFSAGWRSRFMWDYSTCFGRPKRKDRIAMDKFKEHFVIGNVKTVTHNHKQKKYPEGLEYSIVNELNGLLTL